MADVPLFEIGWFGTALAAFRVDSLSGRENDAQFETPADATEQRTTTTVQLAALVQMTKTGCENTTCVYFSLKGAKPYADFPFLNASAHN